MTQHPNIVANWRHLGLAGSVRFATQKMRAIKDSPTCTDTAKRYAAVIEEKLAILQREMQTVILPEPRKKKR